MTRRLVALLAAAALVAGGSDAATATSTTRLPPPTHDGFYRYDGHRPLASLPRGTVVKKRAVRITLGGGNAPFAAEQLLYRTRDGRGRPTVTVTTVLRPPAPLPGPDIVGYLSFYDGFGPRCDPSYTLRGGDPGSPASRSQSEEEELLILHYLSLGLIVTVPDFEGEHWHWGAGREAGYGTLDAITATEAYLGVPRSTRVALSGYSGGAIAADWASELAPRHAPRLNIVGVAEGGIPVDLAHNLRYVNGGRDYAGTIPAVLMALRRDFGVPVHRYLSRYGRRLIHRLHRDCIVSFLGTHPGLTIGRMTSPRYRRLLAIPAVARGLNRLIMGRARGVPRAPLFMGIGDVDGRGDGVMIEGDVRALAHEYCEGGAVVRLTVYRGLGHETAGVDFEPAVTEFLLQRFSGAPFAGNCPRIGRGNSLAPLPVHGRISRR
jgi:hypothetical protein